MSTVALFKEASTVFLNMSLAWMTGAFFARIWLRNCAANWRDTTSQWLNYSMLAAAGMCILSSFCTLWAEAAVMSDATLWEARSAFWAVLTLTHYGRAGLCGLVALLGLGCTYLAHHSLHERRICYGLSASFLLIFAFTRVSVSHAAINGMFGLNVWIEWLHLLLICLWVGAVMVSGWLVLPCVFVFQKMQARATADYLKMLSLTATIALVGIVTTGAYNAYRGLGSLENLSGNAYGNALTIKLCLVAVAIGLGAYNRFIGFPAIVEIADSANSLNSTEAQAKAWPGAMFRLVFVLRLESLVLLGILIAAAVLTGESPP